MSIAYIDTSALIAIEFSELNWEVLHKKLSQFETIVSSNLLEAEYRAACVRENRFYSKQLQFQIDWVHPDRSLKEELITVLDVGYLRGADLWHVAVALYAKAISKSEMQFISLDKKQNAIAATVGLRVWTYIS